MKRPQAKYKKRLSRVGEDPNTSQTKQNQYRTDGLIAHSSNQLNAIELLQVPRISGTFTLNSRLRDIVYLSGFKVCITVENTDAADWLYFNLALVSAKNRGSVGDKVDFFRNYAGESRQINFDDATLNANDRHCLPINTDEYTVHFHERRLISNNASTSETRGSKVARVWTYETYVPIKR